MRPPVYATAAWSDTDKSSLRKRYMQINFGMGCSGASRKLRLEDGKQIVTLQMTHDDNRLP